MPGFDGTGPMGMGPMTGGGRGYCVTPEDGMAMRPRGRRFFGRGGGRGAGRGYAVPFEKEEIGLLKEELAAIQERLSALEKSREK